MEDMMEDMIEYKGYYGSVHCSDENNLLFGKLEFIQDHVSYHGDDIKGLRMAFEEAVDDYLAYHKETGEQPNVPQTPSNNPSSL